MALHPLQVAVRACARAIGMRALRRAAVARAVDEAAVHERRMLALHLASSTDVDAAAAALACARLRKTQGGRMGNSSNMQYMPLRQKLLCLILLLGTC